MSPLTSTAVKAMLSSRAMPIYDAQDLGGLIFSDEGVRFDSNIENKFEDRFGLLSVASESAKLYECGVASNDLLF